MQYFRCSKMVDIILHFSIFLSGIVFIIVSNQIVVTVSMNESEFFLFFELFHVTCICSKLAFVSTLFT